MNKVIRTVLADDHPVFLEGLQFMLNRAENFEVIGTATNGQVLETLLVRTKPDLLVLDLNLPQKDGLEILQILKNKKLRTKTVILTMYDDPKLVKSALKLGAKGYLTKDKNIQELLCGLREALGGNIYVGEGLLLKAKAKTDALAESKKYQDFFPLKHQLTKREREILHLITQALSNKEIARKLFISDQSVGVHRKNIMRKLGVSNTAGLIKIAYDHSLV